ncbi:MAG TPA: SMP-30/gluconolactonase/LRE family protein [Caulobacteraceae bacterium]
MLDVKTTIGESPLWCAAERALYWVDIKRPALYRFEPSGGAYRTWALTSDVGGFALLKCRPGALVALRYGLHHLDFATGALALLAQSPFDPTLFRFNEGACDVNGRFWIGVMFDPLEPSGRKEKGLLHSYTLNGGLRAESDLSDLHNGMAWSSDGRTFYLSHSYERRIFAHNYDPEAGLMEKGGLLATLPEALGIPDGAAVDAEGGYWTACHGGGRLRRFHPDGSVDRDVMLPVSQPTMCAFGGENLDELYVTSARDKLSAGQLKEEPLAGAILRLRPGERGAVRPVYVR